MRFKIFRGFVLFWTIFIALGSFVGSILMLIKPDGSLVFLNGLLHYFSVLPFSDILFQDYIFSGIMLFLINGVTKLIAFILILLNRKSGYVLGTIFGVTLIAWISIQFAFFHSLRLIFFILFLDFYNLFVDMLLLFHIAKLKKVQVLKLKKLMKIHQI